MFRPYRSIRFIHFQYILGSQIVYKPVPVAARSKAYVCGPSPAEIVGSNPTGGIDICLL